MKMAEDSSSESHRESSTDSETEESMLKNISARFAATGLGSTSSNNVVPDDSELFIDKTTVQQSDIKDMGAQLVTRITACRKKLEEVEKRCVEEHISKWGCINSPDYTLWPIEERTEFENYMLKLSKSIQIKRLQSKITIIKQTTMKSKEQSREITKIKCDIAKIRKKKTLLSDVALDIEEDYDWSLIAQTLKSRHTPQVYKTCWQMFVHPSINKSEWTEDEINSLMKIAKKYKNRNWNRVASDLNTSRSGLQCLVTFRSHAPEKWTHEEVENLRRLVEFYKKGSHIPWSKISASIPNHTKKQIYMKYLRLYSKCTGRFLPEEDTVLLTCVKLFGKDYNKMTQYIPDRTSVQLRARHKILENESISMEWTIEEDQKLIELLDKSKASNTYAEITEHFPGKSPIQLRSRYISLKAFLRRNPFADISQAPRQDSRIFPAECDSIDLNKAVKNLRQRLRQEGKEKKEKDLRTKNGTPSGVDSTPSTKDGTTSEDVMSAEEAIDFEIFQTIAKINTQQNVNKPNNLMRDADPNSVSLKRLERKANIDNVKKLLVLLQAKLNKIKIQESEQSKPNMELLQNKNPVVKTYSRKTPPITTKLGDVWGPTIGLHSSTLPSSHDSKNKKTSKSVYSDQLVSRNQQDFMEQFVLLLFRLKVLFASKLYEKARNRVEARSSHD